MAPPGHRAPAREQRAQAGAKVTGGIEACLREGRQHTDEAGHGKADEERGEVGAWRVAVAPVHQGDDEEEQERGAESWCRPGQRPSAPATTRAVALPWVA